ncbi:MAG: LssY C-terminal domain-containing protein, partial [Elusimicrobia bacterium]|nr:LssY C-terminal domain-containing protein [Elusimicrobiota bacterium]
MKRAVLLLPALFLLLSLDRLAPDPAPPPESAPSGSAAGALPSFAGRNAGRFGRPGDPLGFVFAGSPSGVRAVLTAAGWTEVPTAVRDSLLAGLGELLEGRTLTAFPPMNDYRLDGRRQDMNWAIAVRPMQERHHFRLWRTGRRDAQGRELWWGSGNYDLSIRWRDFSHTPDPDADRERDFLVATLRGAPGVDSVALAPSPRIPTAGANDKGYPFRTDGRAALIVLSAP